MFVSYNHHFHAQTSLEISHSGWMCQNPCCLHASFGVHLGVMVYSYARIDCWQVRWCWCWCWCRIRTQSSRGPRSSLMQMLEMAAKIRTKALERCQPGSSKTVWNGWRTMSGPKFLTATVSRPINVRTSYSCLAWPTDVGFDWVCGS